MAGSIPPRPKRRTKTDEEKAAARTRRDEERRGEWAQKDEERTQKREHERLQEEMAKHAKEAADLGGIVQAAEKSRTLLEGTEHSLEGVRAECPTNTGGNRG